MNQANVQSTKEIPSVPPERPGIEIKPENPKPPPRSSLYLYL